MSQPDQLSELFRMQKALNERIGVRTDGESAATRLRVVSPELNNRGGRRPIRPVAWWRSIAF